MSNLSSWLERYSLYFALLVAWVAMLGSLYFSWVAGFIPCELCWYQRILMYPLAILLTTGLLRDDENLPLLVLSISCIGLVVSGYHNLLEKTTLFSGHVCQGGVPCTILWINWFGFITIPFLSFVAFLLISLMSVIAWQAGEPYAEPDRATPWLPVGSVVVPGLLVFAFLFFSETKAPATVEALLSASASASSGATASEASEQGSLLYTQYCAQCHGAKGEGMTGLGTPLVGSQVIQTQSDAALLALIRKGRTKEDPENQSGLVMPPSGGNPALSDAEIGAIVQWMRTLE